MQPGTKLMLSLLAGSVIAAGVVLSIVAMTRDRGGEDSQAVVQQGAPAPAIPTAETRSPAARPVQQATATASSASAGLLLLIFLAAVVIAYLVALILLLAWVARDAKARGDTGVVWLLVVFLFSWVGLLVYLASRTAGQKVPCRRCGNPKLERLLVCPHCRVGPRKRRRVKRY
jgi:hypothetical protein